MLPRAAIEISEFPAAVASRGDRMLTASDIPEKCGTSGTILPDQVKSLDRRARDAGRILPDQVKSLDRRARDAGRIERVPYEVMRDVLAKIESPIRVE